ncbi:hypothetical protein EWM64_g2200 [Hericium alpestre]|uniref:RRM domain-containing protein n=1 Tax=Hericium alpestre TaxID=135208 RepID=A0A4Z0A462_9AGAM|nr:hypothetical protein EWM64_g2200 [Hericium alpestre]
MSTRGRSLSPLPPRDVDIDMENGALDKPDAKVVVVTNLSRNVAETHLQTIFGFYGKIIKVDLPVYAKSGQNRGKAAVEYFEPESAHKAASHMDGGQLDGAVLKVELGFGMDAYCVGLSPAPAPVLCPPGLADGLVLVTANPTAGHRPDAAPQSGIHTAPIPGRALARPFAEVRELLCPFEPFTVTVIFSLAVPISFALLFVILKI